ncbi:MAG: (2Fe-2S) ferredoxin domain-containing protein [Lentisphaeria bacterium]|nr:(2Fe-2S) ferredoxin domain-containing protein [Lentisphaeria bacterium]
MICICMGSSCYARGNEANLALLESFLAEHGLSDSVCLSGRCCACHCSLGPNISIDGKVYHHVDSATLLTLLRSKFLSSDSSST